MSFLNKVGHFLQHLWESLSPKAKWALHVGATVVDKIKEAEENEIAPILAAMAGPLGTKVLELLRAAIPKIAINLRLLDEATTKGLSPDEIAAKMTTVVRNMDKEFRKDFLDSLAVHFAIAATDGKVTWDEIKSTMKWWYDHKYTVEPVQELTPEPIEDNNTVLAAE